MKHEEFLRENDEGDSGFTLNKSKMEGFIEIKIKFLNRVTPPEVVWCWL